MAEEGIYKFLKPYQVEVMRYVWDNAEEGVISNDAWQHLIGLADESVHRSRASVIFFLDDMKDEGFLVKYDKTGKGGKRGVWKPSPDAPCEKAFINEMAMRLVKAAGEILNVTFVTKQDPVA